MKQGILRTLSVAVASAALLAGVMATDSPARGLIAPVTAGPLRPLPLKQLDFNGFFPATISIRVGDSVRWTINGFHTVSILAPGQAPPRLIVPSASPLSGRLDAAGAPFWFNGQPQQIINPAVAAPSGGKTYAGHGYLNSGLPSPSGPPKPFVVKFTKAGRFTFECLVHPGMRGVVRVLPKRRRVPNASFDRVLANIQQAAAVFQAHTLAKIKPPAATVLAGNDSGSVAWLRFFPENLKVKSGTTVDFKLATQREVHTITIGPAAYTTAIEETFTMPKPGAAGPPTLLVNPLGSYPSDPPPLPPYTGANHGNGFEGSGILAAGGGPLPSEVKVTFTKPGVYHYECVVHQGMDGKITVTP